MTQLCFPCGRPVSSRQTQNNGRTSQTGQWFGQRLASAEYQSPVNMQTAVTAYLKSKQLLPFVSTLMTTADVDMDGSITTPPPPSPRVPGSLYTRHSRRKCCKSVKYASGAINCAGRGKLGLACQSISWSALTPCQNTAGCGAKPKGSICVLVKWADTAFGFSEHCWRDWVLPVTDVSRSHRTSIPWSRARKQYLLTWKVAITAFWHCGIVVLGHVFWPRRAKGLLIINIEFSIPHTGPGVGLKKGWVFRGIHSQISPNLRNKKDVGYFVPQRRKSSTAYLERKQLQLFAFAQFFL